MIQEHKKPTRRYKKKNVTVNEIISKGKQKLYFPHQSKKDQKIFGRIPENLR